jgi:hypothetical protein
MRFVTDVPLTGFPLVEHALRQLEFVIGVNLTIMRAATIPPLYRTGVVYRPEPPGPEEIANVLQVLGTADRPNGRRGAWGDCDDLCAYRVAELRFFGEHALPRIVWPKGRTMYHAQVRRGDGSIEDPSLLLVAKEKERRA